MAMKRLCDFGVRSLSGEALALNQLCKDKVVLIQNVASL